MSGKEDTRQRLDLYDAIVDSRNLSNTAKLAAWVLLRHYNANYGCAWPGYDVIARKLGCSRSTAIRAIKELVNGGWFYVSDGGGRGRSNHYTPIFSKSRTSDTVSNKTVSDVIPFPGTETVANLHQNGRKSAPKESHQCDPNPSMNPSTESTYLPRAGARDAGRLLNEKKGGGANHTAYEQRRRQDRAAIVSALADELGPQEGGSAKRDQRDRKASFLAGAAAAFGEPGNASPGSPADQARLGGAAAEAAARTRALDYHLCGQIVAPSYIGLAVRIARRWPELSLDEAGALLLSLSKEEQGALALRHLNGELPDDELWSIISYVRRGRR